jgi:hypothetical protein
VAGCLSLFTAKIHFSSLQSFLDGTDANTPFTVDFASSQPTEPQETVDIVQLNSESTRRVERSHFLSFSHLVALRVIDCVYIHNITLLALPLGAGDCFPTPPQSTATRARLFPSTY